MYKIKYTNFNQTGGVDNIRNHTIGANYQERVPERLTILKGMIGSVISSTNNFNEITRSQQEGANRRFRDKKMDELIQLSPTNDIQRQKLIETILWINKKYLESEDDRLAQQAASTNPNTNPAPPIPVPPAVTLPIPVPPAVAPPPSLTDKEENKLTEQQKEYVMAYMVAINEVSKLNNNAIMTPLLMDFFHKSGFEVNPIGYDLMKTRPSQTFAENDISILLTIGGYKLKSNSGNPIYSRF